MTEFLDVFLGFGTILIVVYFLKHKFFRMPLPDKATKVARNEIHYEKDASPKAVKPKTNFNDVAGLEEVKEELVEIVDFMKNPDLYSKMGAKLPRGILFYGPPGTGKTLLAKALSGECSASFQYACGSEFVEKYVGIGAKRIRTLFEKAKQNNPSIIFIDEIDAVGAKRSPDSNNEKEQTLNQLLVELDGFDENSSVIVIGATNRLDLLDDALLRPGRFDRQMYIGTPDLKVREEILSVHFRNKPLESKLSLKSIAKKTSGMTGAHLASIANESAILAVRYGKQKISQKEVDMAIEKTLAGPERKNSIMTDAEKRKISLHEAGHALLAKYLTDDSVDKISIIPRGKALGYTLHIPDENKVLISEKELKDKIKIYYGGRIAEQVIFNELSSGARDDLEKANNLAMEMVCSLGMSSLGNAVFNEYLIRSCYNKISKEIKHITDECYKKAFDIIEKYKPVLIAISDGLLEKETLHESEIDEIILQCSPDFPLKAKENAIA